MKFKIKYKLSFSDADRLIEKYYEGLTTVEEERKLREFLSQSNLPEHYKPEQAIFGYFDHKKQKAPIRFLPIIRWSGAAAVILFTVFSINRYVNENQTNYAFIDGKKITNVQEIKSRALASLSDISSKNNEVEDGLKNMNNKELIEEQLDIFSGL